MNFGEFLSTKRRALGLSQKDVADYLLISIPTISKWENDERLPDLYSIGKLAKLFQIDLESLLKQEDSKVNNIDDYNEFDINAFASYFKKLRKMNGYSLFKLAGELDVAYQTISKWENGEASPSVTILIKCAKLFDVSIQELYYGKSFKDDKIEEKSAKKNVFTLILSIFSVLALAASLLFFLLPKNENPSSSVPPVISNPYADKVVVTFDFDRFVDDIDIMINKGETVLKYDPNIEGYDVSYLYEDNPFDFETRIYEDIIINCSFNIRTYLVSFYGQHDDLIKQETVEHGGSASAPEISTEDPNFVFYGWDKDFSCVKSNLDVFPIFRHMQADITFDPNGGECDIEYIMDYSPSDYNSLPVARKKGHTFLGWYLDDVLFTDKMEVYEPIILVAKYDANTYRVTLDAKGGEVDSSVIDVIFNTPLSLPVPRLANYDFIGWYYEDTLIPNNYIYDFDFNIDLAASYQLNGNKFSYRLVDNEAIITAYNGDNSDVILPTVLDGYKVVGIDNNAFESVKDNIISIAFTSEIKDYDGACSNLPNLEKVYFDNANMLYVDTLFNGVYTNRFTTIDISGDAPLEPFRKYLMNESNKTFNVICKSSDVSSSEIGNSNDYVHSLTFDVPTTLLRFEKWNNLTECNILTEGIDVSITKCDKLSRINLSEGVTSLDNGCFAYNPSLKTFTVPYSVKTIGEVAFCTSGLEEIYMNNNLNTVNNMAFEACFALKRVYFDGSIQDWLGIDFGDETANPLCYGAKLYIDGVEVDDERVYS